ncbi:hypothetical protein BJ165DRAFT_1532142 [Panaeolus papilionaceus]|nr:hypothetical protein BJ165DRAFT_1532142 [Panaeolus papilionaceus]
MKEFLDPLQVLENVTFVTSMWDLPHNKRVQNRTESGSVQLWDEFVDNGATIERFINTQASAQAIFDTTALTGLVFDEDQPKSSRHIYMDLYQRIENALQEKATIEFNETQPEAQSNLALKSVLERDHGQFVGQLVRSGDLPAGYEDVHRQCIPNMESPGEKSGLRGTSRADQL